MIPHLIGRLAYDIVRFFRDKPFIPCQVEWDYRGHFVDNLWTVPPDAHRQSEIELRRKMESAFGYHDEDDDIAVDSIAEWRGERRRPRQMYPNE